MSSTIRPMHVAGTRLVTHGADALSRGEGGVAFSSPEVWCASISPVAFSYECLRFLELFLEDIGDLVPWNANPKDIAGQATSIISDPWRANVKLGTIFGFLA